MGSGLMNIAQLGHHLKCSRCGEMFLSKPFAGAIPILCSPCAELFVAEDAREAYVEEWR